MQRLRAVSSDALSAAASKAAAASREGGQVVIEDAAGRTLAIIGTGAEEVFGSDEDDFEDAHSDAPRLIASSGSVDFGQSWRS